MVDITHPTVHGHYAALVTHPGYYYLYALYFDYPINNAWFRRREYAELLRERLRVIQPLLALVQPYRKSYALRLFTERRSLERFPVDKVDEAYRQLSELIERIGPPAAWPHGEPPAPPEYVHLLPPGTKRRPRRPAAPARPEETEPAQAEEMEEEEEPAAAEKPKAGQARPYPKSPVDYSQEV